MEIERERYVDQAIHKVEEQFRIHIELEFIQKHQNMNF